MNNPNSDITWEDQSAAPKQADSSAITWEKPDQNQGIQWEKPQVSSPKQVFGGDVNMLKEVSGDEQKLWTDPVGSHKGAQFDMSTPAGRYLHWKHNTASLGGLYADPTRYLSDNDLAFGRNAEESARESRFNPIGGIERGIGSLGLAVGKGGALLNRITHMVPQSAMTNLVQSGEAGQLGSERTAKYGMGTVSNLVAQAAPFLATGGTSAAAEAPLLARTGMAAVRAIPAAAALMGAPAVETSLEKGEGVGQALASGAVQTGLGAALGGGGHLLGEAAGSAGRALAKTEAFQNIANSIKSVKDAGGVAVQEAMRKYPNMIGDFMRMTGGKESGEILAEHLQALRDKNINPDLIARIEKGQFTNTDIPDIVKATGSRSAAKEVMAAANMEAKRQSLDNQTKAFAHEAMQQLQESPNYMSQDEIKNAIGSDKWGKYKSMWLNKRTDAVAAIQNDKDISPVAKQAAIELLNTHGQITDKALELTQEAGFHTKLSGGDYMHRLIQGEAAEGKMPSSFDEDATLDPLSHAHRARKEVVDQKNVGNYADPQESLQHFLTNYSDTIGQGVNGAKTFADELSKASKNIDAEMTSRVKDFLRANPDMKGVPQEELEKSALKSSMSPEQISQAAAEHEQFNQDLNALQASFAKEPQFQGLTQQSTALKTHFANYLRERGDLSPAEIDNLSRVGGMHIDRTVGAGRSDSLVNIMRVAQNLRNSLNPSAALSPLTDPVQMMISGSTDTTLGALSKVMRSYGVSGAIDTAKQPIMGMLRSVASTMEGDWQQGLSQAYDAMTSIVADLHSGMQKVNTDSSMRDLALGRVNATKFRSSVGEAMYDRAVEQAKNTLRNGGEIGPDLNRVLPLVMNEKLPTNQFGQTALFNKITSSPVGKALTMNSSFAAMRLNNAIRIAITAATDKDPALRAHATVGLAQLIGLAGIVEHAFFKQIQEASSNERNPKPRQESVADRVFDILPINRILHNTPPVASDIVKGAGQVKQMIANPESRVKSQYKNYVPPVAATASGFIPMAVKGYEKAKRSLNQ